MDSVKYIGMDVHKETISIAVRNSSGQLVMECIIETKASTILQFFQGLSGSLQVTFEEGTWAAWLYDLLKPHVTELVVCNPRRNALLKEGSKSDRIDAKKLAELLRSCSIRLSYGRTAESLHSKSFLDRTESIRVNIESLCVVRSSRFTRQRDCLGSSPFRTEGALVHIKPPQPKSPNTGERNGLERGRPRGTNEDPSGLGDGYFERGVSHER